MSDYKLKFSCAWNSWILGISWGYLSPGWSIKVFAFHLGPLCWLLEWNFPNDWWEKTL